MSYNLFEESTFSKIKKYLSAVFILFVTFIIPVTVSQIYNSSNSISSSAKELATPTVTPTISAGSNNEFFANIPSIYLVLGLLGVLIVVVWIVLLILYIRSGRSTQVL